MRKPEIFLYVLLSCCFLRNIDCRRPTKPDCSLVRCARCPENHLAVTSVNECCPRCIPQCFCPEYLKNYCPKVGYLLLGESVVIDFGTRECKCIGVNKIKCVSTCPKIPPTCKHIARPLDGCRLCACPTENGNFISAGQSVKDRCKICNCPREGGDLQCTHIC
ncbi:hypothetical protein JRQ81_020121 [Phrynocephalus forsythii]|uniref:Uncharacterized protein n=1 Tax=Phrynocephalus forsythii TaxID=171643 RepID=A0A9Q0XQP7_9SAUR|nr:hypothetical protein JRQ81_020121 [Phrynocephalus forsythii]